MKLALAFSPAGLILKKALNLWTATKILWDLWRLGLMITIHAEVLEHSKEMVKNHAGIRKTTYITPRLQ